MRSSPQHLHLEACEWSTCIAAGIPQRLLGWHFLPCNKPRPRKWSSEPRIAAHYSLKKNEASHFSTNRERNNHTAVCVRWSSWCCCTKSISFRRTLRYSAYILHSVPLCIFFPFKKKQGKGPQIQMAYGDSSAVQRSDQKRLVPEVFTNQGENVVLLVCFISLVTSSCYCKK